MSAKPDAALPPRTADIVTSRDLDQLTENRRILRNQNRRERFRIRYDDDPEFRSRERARKRIQARDAHHKRDAAERLYRSSKARAKRDGIPFNLTLDYVRSLWPADGNCPVLGFRMVLDKERGELPSLDRFEPEKGYVPGNVRIISQRANRLKGDGYAFEFDRIAAYVRSPDPLTFVYKGEDSW